MKMIQGEHECGLAAGNLGIKTPAVVVFLLAHVVKSKATGNTTEDDGT